MRVAALAKRYGKLDALKRVDLDVPAGEAFGLVGANGAGKTTLIKCALDLCAYDSGSVAIFGVAARLPQARRRLVYLPERFVPPHYLRCREFLELMLELSGARYEPARARRLLEELELGRQDAVLYFARSRRRRRALFVHRGAGPGNGPLPRLAGGALRALRADSPGAGVHEVHP